MTKSHPGPAKIHSPLPSSCHLLRFKDEARLAAALLAGAETAADLAASLLTTSHGHVRLRLSSGLLGDNGTVIGSHGGLLGGLHGGRHVGLDEEGGGVS